ncbi:MAG TPA: acyltransferase [Actinoplanes sp.]|nr:acyltransferase [Actinoplanes sp.]
MTTTRLAWLDALRGWAAAVVTLFHLSPAVLGRDLHLRIFHVLDLGKYGVLLFFLVSGYVIPMSLERHGDLRRFWAGRLLRIYPAYLFAIAVTLGLVAAGLTRLPVQLAAETTTGVLGHLTMLQDLLGTPGVLRPFWTLSFEMVFYLVVAGLFTWRWRSAAVWWATGLTVLALTGPPDGLFGATAADRRHSAIVVTALMITVLCAYTIGGKKILILAAGGIGLGAVALPLLNGHATGQVTSASSAQATQMLAVMFAGTVVHHVQYRRIRPAVAVAVLAVVATGVAIHVTPAVAAAVTVTFAAAYALRERAVPTVLARLGAISYSLYLLHLPVLIVVRQFTTHPLTTTVVFVTGSLAAAWAGHRWIERPAQNLARRLPVIKVATEGTDARTPRFGKRYQSV